MQNKLHTTKYCHAELFTVCSRSAASHKLHKPMCHVELVETFHFQISKLLNFQILSVFFFLSSFFATSQNYQWDWALSGGGFEGGTGAANYDEKIYDVKVGTDGNYYFIGTMVGTNSTQLNGVPVTTYNSSLGNNDIFLFSTTCDGTVLWKQPIGGESNDRSFNLALDNNNNVYIAADVTGGTNYNIHFSPNAVDDITPYPANPDAYKRIYLIKYNSSGIFQGKKALQGTVNLTSNQSQILDLAIDSQNQLHFIIGFVKGTHLQNNVTVPNNINAFQYFLVKYNSSLNYIDSMLLPIADGSGFITGQTKFAYNENSNIYYIAGERNIGTNLIYDGDAVVNKAFILAFNGINSTTGVDGEEAWRREIYSEYTATQLADNNVTSLVIDSNSDVYIAGKIWQNINAQTPIKIYDPTNANIPEHTFVSTAGTYLPTVIKFNPSGSVQWVKTPTAFAPNYTTSTSLRPKGLVINGNEVAFGSNEGYFIWDSFTQNYPQFNGTSPTVLRFNKQTGTTIGMHSIHQPGSNNYISALATDSDGNYITGGAFRGSFGASQLTTGALTSAGEADFFVAKLAATPCGSTVSTEDFTKLNVKVYPNPTNDIVTIKTQETLHSYEVYNVLGQQVQNGIFNGNSQINLHAAIAGTYFIKVTTQQGSNATVKVVKK